MIGKTLVEIENFSYNLIEEDSEMEIPEFQQMTVYQYITIDGDIVLEGDLVLMN